MDQRGFWGLLGLGLPGWVFWDLTGILPADFDLAGRRFCLSRSWVDFDRPASFFSDVCFCGLGLKLEGTKEGFEGSFLPNVFFRNAKNFFKSNSLYS